VLTESANVGDKEIEVSITQNCQLGDIIRINDGGNNAENGTVVGSGPLLLQCPLTQHHNIGEVVKKVAGPAPVCAASPTPISSVAGSVRLPSTGGTPGNGAGLPLGAIALGLMALAVAAAAYVGYRRTAAGR
jgi:hypothetical protein